MLSEPAACREPHWCASAFVYRSAPVSYFSNHGCTSARPVRRVASSVAR